MKHYGDITKLSGYELPVVYKVYRYTFPDGMIYIGMTKNSIQYRKDCGYHHNSRLKSAIKAAGWGSVTVDILAESPDRNAAFELEKHYIELFASCDPSVGYNISHGGADTFSGLRHTPEHREYMSNLLRGRRPSRESRAKMSASHSGEWHPVIRFSPNGEVKHYKSTNEAAVDIGGYISNITRACKGISKTYKGYVWKFDIGKEVV